MTSPDHELITISGWADDDAAVLYAAAVLEQLAPIELVERLNELNQSKMLSIGAGQASNLLHEFWDKGYKRMPPKRRAALYARVFGAPAGDAAAGEHHTDFPRLFEAYVEAVADASTEAAGPAATALRLRDNLAAHLDETTAKAATELRGTLAELATVLSDMELRSAYRAQDMWQVIENVQEEFGGGPDVQNIRTRAVAGARVLHELTSVSDGAAIDDALVAAAGAWQAAHSRPAA